MSSPLMLEPIQDLAPVDPPRPSRLWQLLAFVVGWSWRILVGTLFCFSGPYLSWLTSILVVGWLQRWVRARVLLAWWRASPVRDRVPFEQLGETRKDGTPVVRPRWLLPEQGWAFSLWLNFKIGLATLLGIYLVLGLGCLVMFFSWEMGWIISFTKGYEEAWIGITSGILGSLLFIVGFLYLPLARVHAAVVGEARAFFDAKIVWRLIRARPASFALLVLVIGLASLPLEFMKTLPAYLGNQDALHNASDAEILEQLNKHLQGMAFMLFLSLLITQAWAARVYRAALDTALREGWLEPADLGPRLYGVLSRLEMLPERDEPKRGLARILRWTWRWYSRRFIFAAILLSAVGFVAKVYLGEFLMYHPFVGFMNHPLLQFPSVDYVPRHLLH